jgi:RNA polymerase sigma-70 factor (ECF subfamily)
MRAPVSVVEPWVAEYERAYAECSVQVFRFLLAWTNDWSAAQDLTQDAFIRLWAHRASVDWDRPMIGWLLVAARRLAANRFRDLRRRLAVAPSEPFSDETVRAKWMDVRAGLRTLTPLERAALVLTALDGWSYVDLARQMGTTDGALRAAVSRARAKLEDV